MKKLILILKENWEDPVWSTVIATTIFAVATFLLGVVFSLLKSLLMSITFREVFCELFLFFSQDIEINLGAVVILFLFYLVLVSKPLVTLVDNTREKILALRLKKAEITELELPRATEPSTSFFSQRMARAFPGIRDVTWFNNPTDATNRLVILLHKPIKFKRDRGEFESDPIWWFRGVSDMYIDKFERIGRRKVLMNMAQLKIKKIAAFHGDSYYKSFVYVETVGEKQTGLYKLEEEDMKRHIEIFGYSWEEYGLIKNYLGWKTPIRREDYEDGATVVRGKVREAGDAELRVRYLSDYNFIIAAKGSPFNSEKFSSESKPFLDGILTNSIDHEEFFEFLKGFNRNDNTNYRF